MNGEAMANQIEKPWSDWPETAIAEDLNAGWFVKNEGIFKGYSESEFRPHEPLKMRHFKMVLDRAGIQNTIYPSEDIVTVKFSQDYLPETAWSALPFSEVTRFRAAVMIYRHKYGLKNPEKDKIVADKIEQLFKEKPVTWNGVKRYSRLIGHGENIVRYSRQYNIPLWLALGQCWRESQWFTTGLSINYNCGWGIKDKVVKPGWAVWGPVGEPASVNGYTNYLNVDDAIHAYFKLMSSPDRPYKALIEAGDDESIRKALNIYAPAFENDTEQHWQIVKTVRGWCKERGIE